METTYEQKHDACLGGGQTAISVGEMDVQMDAHGDAESAVCGKARRQVLWLLCCARMDYYVQVPILACQRDRRSDGENKGRRLLSALLRNVTADGRRKAAGVEVFGAEPRAGLSGRRRSVSRGLCCGIRDVCAVQRGFREQAATVRSPWGPASQREGCAWAAARCAQAPRECDVSSERRRSPWLLFSPSGRADDVTSDSRGPGDPLH